MVAGFQCFPERFETISMPGTDGIDRDRRGFPRFARMSVPPKSAARALRAVPREAFAAPLRRVGASSHCWTFPSKNGAASRSGSKLDSDSRRILRSWPRRRSRAVVRSVVKSRDNAPGRRRAGASRISRTPIAPHLPHPQGRPIAGRKGEVSARVADSKFSMVRQARRDSSIGDFQRWKRRRRGEFVFYCGRDERNSIMPDQAAFRGLERRCILRPGASGAALPPGCRVHGAGRGSCRCSANVCD